MIDEAKISCSIALSAEQVENIAVSVNGNMEYKWSVAGSSEEIAIRRGSLMVDVAYSVENIPKPRALAI